MLRIKACARCEGDLTLVVDLGESYFSCVQCGYVSYAAAPGDRRPEGGLAPSPCRPAAAESPARSASPRASAKMKSWSAAREASAAR
jgi:hypothetical protein